MTSKVLCRYHMNGMCNKGEHCAFSHDFAAMPSQTCRYYLAGCCAYGDQCRFDHVRLSYFLIIARPKLPCPLAVITE